MTKLKRLPRDYTQEYTPEDQGLILDKHLIATEEVVVGTCLVFINAFSIASTILKPDDFRDTPCRTMYEAMFILHTDRKPIDILSVYNQIKKVGMDQNLEFGHVIDISNRVSSDARLEHYCRIVKQESIRRQMYMLSVNMGRSCIHNEDVFEIVIECDKVIASINSELTRTTHTSPVHIVKELEESWKESSMQGIELFDIEEVNANIGRAKPGNLIILAGRPGMGKSTVANAIIKKLGAVEKRKILCINLEMTNQEVMQRLLCSLSGLRLHTIETGKFKDDEELSKYNQAVQTIYESGIEFVDTSGLTWPDIRARAFAMKTRGGIDMIVVDYGGLVELEGYETRNDEIGKGTKLMKNTAKDLGIPCIVLWQLSRETENRKMFYPRLSDLRDSGNVEQDADMVIFVYRPEYYRDDLKDKEFFNWNGGKMPMKEALIIDKAKHRNGKTGKALCRFKIERFDLEDWEEPMPATQALETGIEELPF